MEFETKIKAKFEKGWPSFHEQILFRDTLPLKLKVLVHIKLTKHRPKKLFLSETARKWMSLAVKFAEKGSEICL